MRFINGYVLLIFIFFILNSDIYPSQDNKKILVLDFKGIFVEEELGIAISDIIRTKLYERKNFIPIEKAKVAEIIHKDLNQTNLMDVITAVKIGQLADADFILFGNILKTGNNYTLNIKYVSIPNSKLIWARSITFQKIDEIPKFCEIIVSLISNEKSSKINKEEKINISKTTNLLNFRLGTRLSNNYWVNHWVMTPTPTLYINYNWVSLLIEGSKGSYSNNLGISGHTFRDRYSLIPMVNIPYKNFYGLLGCGISYIYQRNDYWSKQRDHIAKATEEYVPTIKGLVGLTLPLSNKFDLWFESGGTILNKDHFSFDAGLGLKYGFPAKREHSIVSNEKKMSLMTKSLLGSGLLSSAISYYFKWQANQDYFNYFYVKDTDNAKKLYSNTVKNDNLSKNIFILGIGLFATGLINHFILE